MQRNHFHLHVTCLRNIVKIRWQDGLPDTEVLEKADMTGIEEVIIKAHLRWAGHVGRKGTFRQC